MLASRYAVELPCRIFLPTSLFRNRYNRRLKTMDVPTLILHGDDDQIAPVANAYLSAKLVPNAILKVIPGAPHGLIATHKDQINEAILAFITRNGNSGTPDTPVDHHPVLAGHDEPIGV